MIPEDAETQTRSDSPESVAHDSPESGRAPESPAQDTWSRLGHRADLYLPEDSTHIEIAHQNIPVPSSLSDIPEADIISGVSHSTPDQVDFQVSTRKYSCQIVRSETSVKQENNDWTKIKQTTPVFSDGLCASSQRSSLWPLKTEFEVSLFQHYLVELSPWVSAKIYAQETFFSVDWQGFVISLTTAIHKIILEIMSPMLPPPMRPSYMQSLLCLHVIWARALLRIGILSLQKNASKNASTLWSVLWMTTTRLWKKMFSLRL